MYAVVNTGGKQAKVEQESLVTVEKLDAEVGTTVVLPVLFVSDGDAIVTSPGALAASQVTAEVVEHFKGDKQAVFKFKKRKGYKRTKGHRQNLTRVRIVEIAVGEPVVEKKKAPKAEPKPPVQETVVEPVAAVVEEPAAVVEEAVAVVEEPAEAGQCAALKADGTRCGNKAKEGSEYCGVHAKKYEG
jgi:large subunit ribosomal protein L21